MVVMMVVVVAMVLLLTLLLHGLFVLCFQAMLCPK